MSHLNRAIATISLLVLFAAAAGLSVVLSHDLLDGYGFQSGAGWANFALDHAANWTHVFVSRHALQISLMSAAIAVAVMLMLWIELRTAVAQPRLILSRGHLGTVAISLDQVGMLAQHEAETVTGVREVRTTAESKKAGLEVQQTIAVEPEQQLPALAEEIQQRVKRSLEYHLGFPVLGVRVQLQRASLSKALL